MASESARVTTAAEARYRIDAPNSRARVIKVVALDVGAEDVLRRLSTRGFGSARFLTASTFSDAPREGDFAVWLSDIAGRTINLLDEIEGADLVVMVASAGERADAASLIGEACSLKRVNTTALVLGGNDVPDAALSRTLAQLRPWSLMLVISGAEEYIADMLTALRA